MYSVFSNLMQIDIIAVILRWVNNKRNVKKMIPSDETCRQAIKDEYVL